MLPVLRRFYPPAIGAYFEPFAGSAAVFFDLVCGGRINGRGAVLTDANADLIACYRRVRHSVHDVIAELEQLAYGHAAGGRDHYLHVRDQRFNPMRVAWRDRGAQVDDYPVELAAMLIYLNRTGYNGLFRLNSSGQFNVPPGRFAKPRVLNRTLLTRVAHVLSAPEIHVEQAGFDAVLLRARAGDFVYFDPPYAPVSPTANFSAYTGRLFSEADQRRLQETAIALAQRGVHVLLSNSTATEVTTLYEHHPAVADAGLRSWRVPARRSVNSRPDRRGAVEELIVSNLAGAHPMG